MIVRDRRSIASDLAHSIAHGNRLMHRDASDVYTCGHCGSLCRDPTAVPADLVDRYRDDRYDEGELWRIHRRGVAAHARDAAWLRRHGLRPGSRVLELGSYAGALLATARAAGCRAVGVDVGHDVTAFVRGLGLDVLTGALEPATLPRGAWDSVFVWNCFEQLPDPAAALVEIRHVLPRDGSVVLRTPNAAYVAGAHTTPRRTVAATSGVLGVPFTRCFSPRALLVTLRRAGFVPVEVRGATRPWMDVAARAA